MNRTCDGKRKFVHAQNSVTKSLREPVYREFAQIDNFKTGEERQAKGARFLELRECATTFRRTKREIIENE